MKKIDFLNSKFIWTTIDKSCGRFSIEAICEINDKIFHLTSEVAACNMYEGDHIMKQPPYLYQAIYNEQNFIIIRTSLNENSSIFNSIDNTSMRFLETRLIQKFTNATKVEFSEFKTLIVSTENLIVEIIINSKDWPIQTISFPIKHFNYHLVKNMIQIETGPLLIFDKHLNPLIGFIAFRNMNEIEFQVNYSRRKEQTTIKLISSNKIYKYNT